MRSPAAPAPSAALHAAPAHTATLHSTKLVAELPDLILLCQICTCKKKKGPEPELAPRGSSSGTNQMVWLLAASAPQHLFFVKYFIYKIAVEKLANR
jgi:hypothetical protein